MNWKSNDTTIGIWIVLGVIILMLILIGIYFSDEFPVTHGIIINEYQSAPSEFQYIISYGHNQTFDAQESCSAWHIGQNVTFGNDGNGNQIFSPSYNECFP
jgi:hypothetical protein